MRRPSAEETIALHPGMMNSLSSIALGAEETSWLCQSLEDAKQLTSSFSTFEDFEGGMNVFDPRTPGYVVVKTIVFTITGLGRTTVGSVSRAFGRQSGVRNAQVESEPCRHVPVVVEAIQVHWQEETAKFDVMLDEFVFQLPGIWQRAKTSKPKMGSSFRGQKRNPKIKGELRHGSRCHP